MLATLRGTVAGAPVVGLIAHVDTSPDAPGTDVMPLVHRAWDGEPIVLPGDPTQILDPATNEALASRVGHDIVTSDGTTLLGADDKAGIAEIMAAVAYLIRDDAPRAPVRVVFTVDEEIGRGTDFLDLDHVAADLAYTLDGSGLGELEVESFSAYQLVLTVHGVSVHPGSAKGKLVNALKLVADIVAALPRDTLSPETTDDREGFVHPNRIEGGATEATLWWIIRDHDDAKLDQHVELVRRIASEVVGAEPRASFTIEVEEQYRNMRCRPRSPSHRRRRGRGGDPARRCRAGANDHSRRNRRLPAERARASDTEPLHRRSGLPLGARVGLRAGHGRRRSDGRRAGAALGRALPGRPVACGWPSGEITLAQAACSALIPGAVVYPTVGATR